MNIWKWRWFWMRVRMKINFWIDDYMPVFCTICEKVIFSKDATYEQTLTGQSAPLCKKCHEKWFGRK